MSEDAPTVFPAAPLVVSLWRNRDYLLLWSGQTVSALGNGIVGLAWPLLVLAMTHSAAQAGLVEALYTLPFLLISLPAGVLIDRWHRKRVMMLADTAGALALGSIPLAAVLGHLSMLQIYLASAINGAAFVFFNIAEVAALPRVVDPSQLSKAFSQNHAAQCATGLVSPPLGGLIFQTLGHTIPFLFGAVSSMVSVLSLFFIGTEFQLERAMEPRRLLPEIREGLRWLWRQPVIYFTTFLSGGFNCYMNAFYLIMIILATQRGASPSLIGVMFALVSAGGLCGSLIAPRVQTRFGYTQVILCVLWVQALIMPLIALAPNPLILGVLGTIGALGFPIYNVTVVSYRASRIPDALQGRVNSAVRMITVGSVPLGTALAGILVQDIGAVPTVLIFGGLAVGLAVLASTNPYLRTARTLDVAPGLA